MYDKLADWVQAAGSMAAIIIAIWTVRHQASKERDNRVIDDAAFASYIRKFLSEDIELKIATISQPSRILKSGSSITEISNQAFSLYNNDVILRLEKLAELPLTDWPDIEFANAFNDTTLRMKADLGILLENKDAVQATAERELEQNKEQAKAAAFARSQELSDLEEEADEIAGAIDDGKVERLLPRGQRHKHLEFNRWKDSLPDDDWESFEDRKERDRVEMASWERAWGEQEQEFKLDRLKEDVLDPLVKISLSWSDPSTDLAKAIERYIDRAKRYGLPTTYDGRASRPKRLGTILR